MTKDRSSDEEARRKEAEQEDMERRSVTLYGALEERHPLDDLIGDVAPNRDPNLPRLVEPAPMQDPALVDPNDVKDLPEPDCD